MAVCRVSTINGFALVSAILCHGPTASAKGPIKVLSIDPAADVVELFEGAERGDLRVRIITKDARTANVFIENTTSQPLTVAAPPALAAIHVLKQFQPFPNQQPLGIAPNPNVLSQGQGQSVAGPLDPLNGPFPQANGPQFPQLPQGMNFFSIPAERSVWLQLNSVCLDHGKPNPKPKMTYVVVPIETRVESPVLREVLSGYDAATEQREGLQAAAWHFTNEMSWEELTSLPVRRGNIVRPYFEARDLKRAKSLVKEAEARIERRENEAVETAGRSAGTRVTTSIE